MDIKRELYWISGGSQFFYPFFCLFRMSTALEPIEWSCLVNHGFQDSPVSFPNHEHSYDINGDNITAIVNFKNNNFWQYIAMGKLDTLR